MLADAIRSETYRLSKNRTALFWSVLFIPIMGVILATLGFVVAKANEAKLAGKLPPASQRTMRQSTLPRRHCAIRPEMEAPRV